MHFNILLDQWLQDPQSDVAWWFGTQWHVVPSRARVASMADPDACLRELEGCSPKGQPKAESLIDVVAVSHESTDHCHRAGLPPVFARDVAAHFIHSWDHFGTVITMPGLSEGVPWSRLTVGALPDWFATGRIITPGNALYYHSAVLITFDLNGDGSDAEAIVYSPHGIESGDLAGLPASGVGTLALLH